MIGDYDLLVKFRVPEGPGGIEKFLDEKVRKIEGITASNTLVTQHWFS